METFNMSIIINETNLNISRLSPAIGAVVTGVDIAKPLSDEVILTIKDALDKYLVLFFENQEITALQQRDFAKRFGELSVPKFFPHDENVPEIMILAHDHKNKARQNVWHTDTSYLKNPPYASLLYTEEVPEIGGDTLWANMYSAYEALSPSMQRFCSELYAYHDFAKSYPPDELRAYGISANREKAYAENPATLHPVIRVNPINNRKAIFVNSLFTTRIDGISSSESNAILNFLFEHINQPEFQVRWRWKAHCVAFWNNHWSQHYAVSDYFPNPRCIRRAVILAE